ncbi:hypothetical protein [Lactobacillus helveticus]|nr:hypothetical protein [Lactobacillus helveticus]
MLERKLLPLSAMVLALGLSGLTTHVKAADTPLMVMVTERL